VDYCGLLKVDVFYRVLEQFLVTKFTTNA